MADVIEQAWLTLADGLAWRYTASDSGRSWLNDFARTLGLPRQSPNSHRDVATIHVTGDTETTTGRPFTLGELNVFRGTSDEDLIYNPPPREETNRENWLYSQWYSLYPLYPRLLRHGHLPLHAALVTRNSRGLLLSAPGGTGKSTAAHRLPNPWSVWGDDESWLVSMPDGTLHAHPLPTWSDLILRHHDRSWSQPDHVPVDAILFLRQGDKDELTPLSPSEAAVLLFQAAEQMFRRAWSVLQPPDLTTVRQRILDTAAERAATLPAYSMTLTLNGPFWELLNREGLCTNNSPDQPPNH